MITPDTRGYDPQGAGHYGASRGSRSHNGVDFVTCLNEEVKAFSGGEVTKIGYPYAPTDITKGHFRYVEITGKYGLRCRYFYVSQHVSLGDILKAGDIIGTSQSLTKVYPGITQHFHFEVKTKRGKFIDPHCYFDLIG